MQQEGSLAYTQPCEQQTVSAANDGTLGVGGGLRCSRACLAFFVGRAWNTSSALDGQEVFASTCFGFLGLKVGLEQKNGLIVIDCSDGLGCQVMYDYLVDPEEWRCVDVSVVVPGDPEHPRIAGEQTLHLVPNTKSDSLVSFAVRRGLKNFTAHSLRKLFGELGVKYTRGQKPATEAALLRSIAKHVLGHEYNDAVGEALMVLRTIDDDADELSENSPLLKGDVLAVLEGELEENDMLEEIAEIKHEVELKRLRNAARRKAAAPGCTMPLPGTAERGTPKPRLKPITRPATGWTQAEANKFVPPSASISKEQAWHTRWKLRAPYLGEKSKSYTAGDEDSDNAALMHLLRLGWAAWANASGEDCPLDLGAVV